MEFYTSFQTEGHKPFLKHRIKILGFVRWFPVFVYQNPSFILSVKTQIYKKKKKIQKQTRYSLVWFGFMAYQQLLVS